MRQARICLLAILLAPYSLRAQGLSQADPDSPRGMSGCYHIEWPSPPAPTNPYDVLFGPIPLVERLPLRLVLTEIVAASAGDRPVYAAWTLPDSSRWEVWWRPVGPTMADFVMQLRAPGAPPFSDSSMAPFASHRPQPWFGWILRDSTTGGFGGRLLFLTAMPPRHPRGDVTIDGAGVVPGLEATALWESFFKAARAPCESALH